MDGSLSIIIIKKYLVLLGPVPVFIFYTSKREQSLGTAA